MDGLGVVLAFCCAIVYAAYILVSDAVVQRVNPLPLAAAVCTGAAISFTVAAAVSGNLPTSVSGSGWATIAGLAVVSTVVSITALAAGTARVGPSTAAILSTFEPVVTAALAFAVFEESLGPVQLVGGFLVLTSVAILHARWLPSAGEAVAQGAP